MGDDDLENQAPRGIDPTTPSTARMYDYFLGGKDHFPVDKEAGERFLQAHPETVQLARANRSFLRRAVHYLAADCGIGQFLEIGAGMPTSPNVHEVAGEVHPGARVAYVDHDPIVLAHGRALLATTDQVDIVDADMTEPATVIRHPQVQRLIDFEQPVAVLFVGILHFVPTAANITDAFRRHLAPGSYLVISHATSDGLSPERQEAMLRVYREAAPGATIRSGEQVRELFAGFELVDPGLATVTSWRADEPETPLRILAGVGRKIDERLATGRFR